MKNLYYLFLTMLLAFVGYESAWAETTYNSGTVDVSDLKEDDIVCAGVEVTNNDYQDAFLYESKNAFNVAPKKEDYNSYIWDFPFTTSIDYVIKFNEDYCVCFVPVVGEENDNFIVNLPIKLMDEDGYHYASFFSSTNWVVPAKDRFGYPIEVYVIEEVNGTEITLKYIAESGHVIPGGIAVLLRSHFLQDVTINKPNADSADPIEYDNSKNLLWGSDTDETFSDERFTYYILSKVGDVAGFYWQSGSQKGNIINNAAHKAFLRIPKDIAPASNGITFRFDDTITDINSISNLTVGTYYNLQGQRIAQMSPMGICIKNGKKCIVR